MKPVINKQLNLLNWKNPLSVKLTKYMPTMQLHTIKTCTKWLSKICSLKISHLQFNCKVVTYSYPTWEIFIVLKKLFMPVKCSRAACLTSTNKLWVTQVNVWKKGHWSYSSRREASLKVISELSKINGNI